MIGQTLSHFKVTAKLGEGGMGEVYRAEDLKLGREVAIKVLPQVFVADSERLSRFEREARVLAALNHPNIAAIYQVDAESGRHFLVMELVEGVDMSTRLAGGPLPVEEVLSFTSQLADALETAHENGIIHRDLKPANIKIRPDGTVKILDFGLAKALETGTESLDEVLSMSPTVPIDSTEPGMVLGTARYMSPEQARGRVVDRRADLWALGCVVYECLAGRAAFDAPTVPDLLAEIASSEPDLEALPDGTPEVLRWVLRRCFEKDPRQRLRDAGEIRIAIERQDDQSSDLSPGQGASQRGSGAERLAWLPWVLVAGLSLALVISTFFRPESTLERAPSISRWSIPLPAGHRVEGPRLGGNFDYSHTVAISPDGSYIVFSVYGGEDQTQLFIKSDETLPRAIPGTVDARAPFFSPDGEWLGFYRREGGIYKVSLEGGTPQKICDLENVLHFDASWSPDGSTIVFATDNGLSLVGLADGVVEKLTDPEVETGDIGHHSPRFAADGESIFFTVSGTKGRRVEVLSLPQRTVKTLVEDASLAVPLGRDRLVFARSGELVAAFYDPREQSLVGSAVTVLEGVETTSGLGGMVLTQFDVSETGTLAYVPSGETKPYDRLVWVDRSGQETLVTEGPGKWIHPRLSPDGRRVSVDIHSDEGKRDVYIYEIDRDQLRELTSTGISWESEWSPDGEHITILSGAPAGRWSLFWVATDFSGPAELLMPSRHAIPGGWLPDGNSFLYTEWVEGGIWQLRPGASEAPELVLKTSSNEVFPRLSADGRWMAYVASEAGRNEVFVQAFPELGPKYKISNEGGTEPVWSRDGRTLFYRSDDRMFAVEVEYGAEPTFSRPRLLFRGEYDDAAVGHQHYDVSLDGERLLMIRRGEPPGLAEIRVILNWSREVDSRLPTR